MKSSNTKAEKRVRRHARIRSKISGTSDKPRLSVFKSNTAISAQVIDDEKRITICTARGTDPEKVGGEISKLAQAKGVGQVVFDRGGYIYVGKIKVLAESARTGGLKF